MAERNQRNRWRCTQVGCNPVLHGESAAGTHVTDTGHRVAKWPIRSAAGKAKARARNRSGYYDKYNVGAKSAEARGLIRGVPRGVSSSEGSICQGEDGEDYWGDSTG